MRIFTLKGLVALCIFWTAVQPLSSQHLFTQYGSAGAYSQLFESFAGTPGSIPANWTNSFNDYVPGGYYSNTGSYSNQLSTYALNQQGAGEYAIGSKIAASGGTQAIAFSARNGVVNGTITGFTVSWDVEQYSTGGRATAANFAFSGGGSISGNSSFAATTGSNANLPSVSVAGKSVTITGLNIAYNATFSFTWTISTGSGSGDNGHVGIDNVVIIANGTVLPVELTSFRANAQNREVALQWSTATETNNAFFAVERASNGHDFTEIGRVEGAGDSRMTRTYQYSDAAPPRGQNLYRLRQVDYDGAFAFSPVVAVSMGADNPLRLFPSQTNGQVTVLLNEPVEESAAYQVFDLNGREVLKGVVFAETDRASFDAAFLPAGRYVFRLARSGQATVATFFRQ